MAHDDHSLPLGIWSFSIRAEKTTSTAERATIAQIPQKLHNNTDTQHI